MLNGKISIRTKDHREIVDITEDVDAFAAKHHYNSGLCHLSLLHTTAALTTADLDPGTDQDMLDAFEAVM
ncbi:MAG TPA: YjbQ family protein, partial [Acidobacteriota bacterium]|nr:YjbQ family protein [Acidobacteriota bacterium]